MSRRLFTVEEFKGSDYAGMVAEVSPRCAALEEATYVGSQRWEETLASGRAADPAAMRAAQAALSPEDPINIQYTSGTTGFPKGATLSHRNILNNGYFVGELLGYTEQDRICVPVPFYHCFGMVMGNLAATSHGACVVIPAPGFDPAATLRAASEERCTSLYGVPTMFIGVLNEPDFASFDLSAMRTGIMAGSPCPVEVMKQVTQWAARGVHLLRNDRDLAGLHADPDRRLPRPEGRHRRPGAPACRGEGGRHRLGRDRSAW